MKTSLLNTLKDLGFSRVGDDKKYCNYKIFTGMIRLPKGEPQIIYIDTCSKDSFRLTEINPLWVTEGDYIVDFPADRASLINVLMKYAFRQGEIERALKMKQAMSVF